MSARNQFTPTKADEQSTGYGANIGGAVVKDRSNFSIAVNGQSAYTTPNLNVALPDGSTRFDVCDCASRTTASTSTACSTTRSRAIRHCDSDTRRTTTRTRTWESAPTICPSGLHLRQQRLHVSRARGRADRPPDLHQLPGDDDVAGLRFQSAIEAPTIIVQDAFTSGGAQQAGRVHGRNMTLASDVDYVRGIHSWRGGVQLYGDWYHANLNNNYLGTYTFSSLEAFEAGTPLLYTRSVGDPTLNFFHARLGDVLPGRLRIHKGLTLSPGVRYSYQTRVDDDAAFEPRVGVTWAPTKSGQDDASSQRRHLSRMARSRHLVADRAFRRPASARRHHPNPSYPDPGTGGVVPLANTYRLGDYKLNKNVRYSAGVDQQFSPRASVNVLFNYYHQDQLPRGMNLNPVVDGVRPDPALRQHHRDRDRRADHPARAVRQLQPQSSRRRPRNKRHVQLAAARHERQLLVHSRAAKCARARSTCRQAARSTPNGAAGLPTIRTASTSTLTSTQLKNLAVGLLDQCVGRISATR